MADPLFYDSISTPYKVLSRFQECKKNQTPYTPDYEYFFGDETGKEKGYCVDTGLEDWMEIKDEKGRLIPHHSIPEDMFFKLFFKDIVDARVQASMSSKKGRGYAIVEIVHKIVKREKSLLRSEKAEFKSYPLEFFVSGELIDVEDLFKYRTEKLKSERERWNF
jgi:hypothetical protein